MDEQEFEAWLKKQDRETCVKIATRAALRVLPFVIQPKLEKSDSSHINTLVVLRTVLTTVVASRPEMKNHLLQVCKRLSATTARMSGRIGSENLFLSNPAFGAMASASEAADSIGDEQKWAQKHALQALDFSTLALSLKLNIKIQSLSFQVSREFSEKGIRVFGGSQNDSERNLWVSGHLIRSVVQALPNMLSKADSTALDLLFLAANSDKAYRDDNADLLTKPLWGSVEVPDTLQEEVHDFVGQQNVDPAWTFWREWYQGFLDGKPMDWELQRRVALIPDEDWEEGPAHIAEIIARIRLRFRTAVAPPLVRDEEGGVFRVERDAPLPGDVLEYACKRIDSALNNALATSGANGLREDSYETLTIRGAMASSRDASLLAVGFFDACLSFQRNIGDRYPDDTALINLQNALYAVVEEINEQHEAARKRCARLASLTRPEPLTPADREEIARVPEEIRGELDGEAQGIIESDVEAILAAEQPSKWRRARFTNWVTTVSQWMDKAMKGDKRARWFAGLVGRLVKWWAGADDVE